MGNIISKLLAAEEPHFSLAIKQLEKSSGYPSMDVRLMSEIIQKVRTKITELGLDPKDTTGEELYYTLLGKLKQHDEHLAMHIGASDSTDPKSVLPKIKRTLDKSNLPKSVWVIKKSVVKRLIHAMPPEKLMKHLGYNSVESMTKRENVLEVAGALRFAESPAWLKKFNKAYKSLTPSDFETRDIEVLVLDKQRYGSLLDNYLHHKQYSLTHMKELGVVLLLPPRPEKVIGFTMATMAAALHYIQEIRLYSAFFKLQQVQPDFGRTVASILNEDVNYAGDLAGQKVHWRIVGRHFGRAEYAMHPEIFQPHIQPEDLSWRRAEDMLFDIDPELRFWRGLDYVGVLLGDDAPVSFNLMDISMSYYLGVPYRDRIVSHMRASLWNELFMRYMGEKVFESSVLAQLDSNILKSDKLKLR